MLADRAVTRSLRRSIHSTVSLRSIGADLSERAIGASAVDHGTHPPNELHLPQRVRLREQVVERRPGSYGYWLDPRQRLAQLLGAARGRGSFSARRTASPDDLHIDITGVGPLRMPVSAAKAKRLIAVARPAQYGKGEP